MPFSFSGVELTTFGTCYFASCLFRILMIGNVNLDHRVDPNNIINPCALIWSRIINKHEQTTLLIWSLVMLSMCKGRKLTTTIIFFVTVPNLDDFDELADSLIEVLQSECQYPHPFHKIEDPHISVTRTLKLRHHWLPDMTKSLTAIANTHRR